MDEPTKSDPSTSLLSAILNWTGKDFVKNQTESMVVRCDGPFNLYSSVEIVGVVLDSSLVKVSEGSTIVDINVAYLNKLAVGQHKLTVNFSDGGKAEGTFTVSDKGAVTNAVVGLFPIPILLNVIDVAVSDNDIASTKPELLAATEYA